MRAGRLLSRPFGWRTAAAGVAVLVLAGLIVLVTVPTLLRPLIQNVVRSHSGRAIDFAALHFALDASLQPRLRFDDLVIENASWATSREPLVKARRAGLDLTWQGLFSGTWEVRRLALEDASVDLERDAAGRRNSRLSTADGLGPAHAQVLSVDGRRTRMRVADAVTGFELTLGSTPLASPRALPGHAELPLTRTLVFEGRQRGTAFSGQADVSDTLTLQRTGADFALQGEIRTEGGRLQLSGVVADLLAPVKVDADVHLDADPLSKLHPGLMPKLPPLRQVSADAHLRRDTQRWALENLQARTRHSAFDGGVEFRPKDAATGRPRLDARLRAMRFDLDEAIEARGATTARTVASKAAGAAAVQKPAASASAVAAPDPPVADVVPGAPFDWTGLNRLEAAVDLMIVELVASNAVVARDARLQTTLDHGRLHIAVPGARVAGGDASADMRLDAASPPASASLQARLNGLRLRELPGAWHADHAQVNGGRLSATAELQVRGRSVAEWLASASGTTSASLDGASVSDRLEAKLGLDGLGFLRSVLGGAEAVPLRCAGIALDLQGGRGSIRRLTLDTARTAVSGRGSIDFVHRSLDVVLAPSSHVDALFALDRDIHLQGPIAKPRVSLQASGPRRAPAPCPPG